MYWKRLSAVVLVNGFETTSGRGGNGQLQVDWCETEHQQRCGNKSRKCVKDRKLTSQPHHLHKTPFQGKLTAGPYAPLNMIHGVIVSLIRAIGILGIILTG